MRIVVDAMGSDDFPAPDVTGAVLAAKEYGETIILVGDETRIKGELARQNTTGLKLDVVHAHEAVSMTDKPTVAAKDKPESSMHVGMRLVRDGKADAFVSMGNTGAILTIATLYTLRRIEGVKRPAISAVFSLGSDDKLMILDAGANTEGKPEWLAQFATMGSLYASTRWASRRRAWACCRMARKKARARRSPRKPQRYCEPCR
ncbi:MAG: hypothetical protein HC828_11475 [Blastochloris sp.]|nr:hypothetical protein [Blastochloris sp.]